MLKIFSVGLSISALQETSKTREDRELCCDALPRLPRDLTRSRMDGGACATHRLAQAACYKRYMFSAEAKQEKKCGPLFARWVECLEAECHPSDPESVRVAIDNEELRRRKFQTFGRKQCSAR